MTRHLARYLVVVGLVVASTASASPKRRDARAAFDKGVAAYQRGDFAAASEHLGTSFKLEADVETLFAWAQSERQLEHCDRAVELFGTLLDFDMPAENKKAVQAKIDECKVLVAEKKAKEPKAKEPERVLDKPASTPDPSGADKPAAKPERVADAGATGALDDPSHRDTGEPSASPWWKDPIGDALLVTGIAGLGVGGYFLVSAKQAQTDAENDVNYWRFDELDAKATRNGTIGLISVAVGGALVVGGIVRYATCSSGRKTERTTVTGWLAPGAGGLTALGRF